MRCGRSQASFPIQQAPPIAPRPGRHTLTMVFAVRTERQSSPHQGVSFYRSLLNFADSSLRLGSGPAAAPNRMEWKRGRYLGPSSLRAQATSSCAFNDRATPMPSSSSPLPQSTWTTNQDHLPLLHRLSSSSGCPQPLARLPTVSPPRSRHMKPKPKRGGRRKPR